jgi:CubicO group peptidase (beta-lactamase class C family)
MRRCTAVLGVLIVTNSMAMTDVRAQALAVAVPEEVGMSSARLARIRPLMQAYVDEGKLSGVLTLVARRGKVVHFETVGQMDVEAGAPMRSDTIFRIYSMSKVVNAVAVMMLLEEGKLLLTDPVADHLPELAEMRVYVADTSGSPQTESAHPITVLHLLTHTSGFVYGGEDAVGELYRQAGISGTPSRQASAPATLEDFIQRLATLPLAAQPGTAFHYGVSNDVLGRLVEVISGLPYDEFLSERIFAPLGMVDTDFHVPDSKIGRFAANYAPAGGDLPDALRDNDSSGSTGPGSRVSLLRLVDAPRQSVWRDRDQVPYAGAGLVSTATDYLRFAQMLLNGGGLDGARLLSRKTVELMMRDHTTPMAGPDPLRVFADYYEGCSAGFGFGLTGSVVIDAARTCTPGSVGSFSWGGAASTEWWLDPHEEIIGMLFTQQLGSPYPLRAQMKVMTYQALVD